MSLNSNKFKLHPLMLQLRNEFSYQSTDLELGTLWQSIKEPYLTDYINTTLKVNIPKITPDQLLEKYTQVRVVHNDENKEIEEEFNFGNTNNNAIGQNQKQQEEQKLQQQDKKQEKIKVYSRKTVAKVIPIYKNSEDAEFNSSQKRPVDTPQLSKKIKFDETLFNHN